MNRRKLLGFFGVVPFLTFSNSQAKPSNDSVEWEWAYIGVFEWGDDQCLAEVGVNTRLLHRPDVIAMACTRVLQECAYDGIIVKSPRFKFSKISSKQTSGA
jgi:hypothetical protein